MKNTIDSWRVQHIMDEWAKECGDSTQVFFNIKKNEVIVYSTRPGVLIGRAGERINRYKTMLKEVGAKKVMLDEVEEARIPEYTYGMEVCPLNDNGGACYDFDRFGTIACGLCGANKPLAEAGQKNFLRGMKNMTEN